MDDLTPFAPLRSPTAERPLLGQTMLIVEDSLFACEALRQMALRSGARIRRADCLGTARRHLRVYRPSVAVIDLGLPDGSGIDLIEELHQSAPRVPVLLATSGDDFGEELAIAAGADGFLPKPIAALARFQAVVLAHLPPEMHPAGLRALPDDLITPDPVALRDDLEHAAQTLAGAPDDVDLAYVAQFLDGIATSAKDGTLKDAVSALRNGDNGSAAVSDLRAELDSRIAAISPI